MKQWMLKNIEKLALLGAVTALVGISFGARSSTGGANIGISSQSDTQIKRTGEKQMLTATKQESKVHHADDTNFGQVVLKSDVPVLVDFYADWCGPCRMIAPVLEELARETTDAKIVKVNVDQSPQLAARYGVNSIPSLKVFQDGEVVDEHVGLARKADLKKMLGS
jgi:thioredoxin 1